MRATQYMDAIIPCRPTSPDVKVDLLGMSAGLVRYLCNRFVQLMHSLYIKPGMYKVLSSVLYEAPFVPIWNFLEDKVFTFLSI